MSGQIELTYDLARDLLDWYGDGTRKRIGYVQAERVELLPRPPEAVLRYLLDRCGDALLIITPEHGTCIDASLAAFEIHRAEAVVCRLEARMQDEAERDLELFVEELEAEQPATPSSVDETGPIPGFPTGMDEDVLPWCVTNPDLIEHALKREGTKDGYHAQVKRFKAAAQRTLPKASLQHVSALDELGRRFPNFSDVITSIRRSLHLQIRTGGAVHVRPQLLLGPPGVGKTAFARSLAEALGGTLVFQSLAELSGGFVINGNNSRWNGSAPGMLARAIGELPAGQVLVVLFDELDKVLSDSNFPADRVLLGLLEASTATRYQDEYLELPMDVSKVLFLFTANRIDGIRPELLSRMAKTVVHAPRPEDMPAVVRSVDAVIRQEQPPLARLFAPITDEVIGALTKLTPRQVYQALMEGYARACEASPPESTRLTLTPDVLPTPGQSRTPKPAGQGQRDWPLLIAVHASRRLH